MGVDGILRAAGFARLAALVTLVHDRMCGWPGHGYQQTGRRLGYRPAIALAVAAVAFSSMCQTAEAQQPKPRDVLVYPLDGFQVLKKLHHLKDTVSSIRIPKCRQSEGVKENIERLEAVLRLDGSVNVSPDFDLQPGSGPPHYRGSDYQEAVKQAEETLAKLKALPPCNLKPKARHLGKGKGVKNLHMPQRQRIGMGSDVPHVETASFSGFYVGANIAGISNTLGQTETFKMTNVVTNNFSDSSSGIGGGFEFGYLFALLNTNIVVGPFASVEFINQSTNHTFPGGFFLGQTTNTIGTVGGQLGVIAAPGVMLYGEFGAAFANLDQKLNFSGPVTSASQTVTGANIGLGVAIQPTSWRVGGMPVAFTAQFNHIFLPGATFDNAGSPGYGYHNDTSINQGLVGLRFNFAASPPPPPR
jgi:opacity protein-like surface antigen